jgi:hypothetical protein
MDLAASDRSVEIAEQGLHVRGVFPEGRSIGIYFAGQGNHATPSQPRAPSPLHHRDSRHCSTDIIGRTPIQPLAEMRHRFQSAAPSTRPVLAPPPQARPRF